MHAHPSQHCEVIAITGTSGKTSVCQLLAQSLRYLGKNVATLGTLGGGLTTPDAPALLQHFTTFANEKMDVVVMEASSHGLHQGRMKDVHLDTVVFTNLTQDHLDYHQTLEAYGEAKAKLFQWPSLTRALVNLDDPFTPTMLEHCTAQTRLSVSLTNRAADVFVAEATYTQAGITARVETPQGLVNVNSSLLGAINLHNLLMVIAYLTDIGVPISTLETLLSTLTPIPGRLEICPSAPHQPIVVVDYAHKPGALEQVIAVLKPLAKRHLWCVVGCGGNRDKLKRPLMAKIGAEAHHLILTSDNPRDEEPEQIIRDMQAGLQNTKTPVTIWVDRKQAIQYAINHATSDDIVLIAGRGHETHQTIQGQQWPFDDRQVVQHILQGETV
jgi:UDP-N-acetylmuramoyl-L-alanyl-D-glutamate--2,6-diaminopimelate ligase